MSDTWATDVLANAIVEGRYERDRVDHWHAPAWEAEARAALAAVEELIDAARATLEVGFNVAPTPSRRRLSEAVERIAANA